jgi:hypothetical protein
MVRGTADPSAALWMTKGRVALPFGVKVVMTTSPMRSVFYPATAYPATALHGSVAFPFVIPSAAEGSAVLRTIPGNV